MEKGFIHLKVIIVADEQATKGPRPGKGPFDFPTLAITPQPTAIVEGWFCAPSEVRADQQHAVFEQPFSQRIAAVGAVGHDSQRPFLWTASSTTGHRYSTLAGIFGSVTEVLDVAHFSAMVCHSHWVTGLFESV